MRQFGQLVKVIGEAGQHAQVFDVSWRKARRDLRGFGSLPKPFGRV